MHILVAKRPLEITLFVSFEIALRLLNAYRILEHLFFMRRIVEKPNHRGQKGNFQRD